MYVYFDHIYSSIPPFSSLYDFQLVNIPISVPIVLNINNLVNTVTSIHMYRKVGTSTVP